MSSLIRWLKERGYWTNEKGVETTHVFLNGGKACVPYVDMEVVYKMYVDDIQRAVPMYLVERTYKSGSCRMFADFDYKPKVRPTEKDAMERDMMDILSSAMRHLPEPMRGDDIVICVREAGVEKIGVHLVWQTLHVTNTVALGLRDAWVHELELKRVGSWAWSDIIDAAVYKNNGLRLAYSQKRGEPDNVYIPVYMHTRSGEMVPISDRPLLDLVRMSSLMATPVDMMVTSLDGYRPVRPVKSLPVINVSDATLQRLMAILPEPYKSGRLGQVCQSKKGALIVSSSSRYCMIVGREHTNNHVYFEVSKSGCVNQLCHSQHCKNKRAVVSSTATANNNNTHNRLDPKTAATFWLNRVQNLAHNSRSLE